ncbi:Fungal Zn2-Cys6 binuclear cluster domain-containing protein [Cladophialophora immunda]|nr:Fungal Zn2-Cys6 binuclear cluster domain-containing protein [Cladophialophora immunda]
MLTSDAGAKARPASMAPRGGRAARACLRCHARKVRCNAASPGNDGQCSSCVSIGVPCELGPERRRQYRQRQKGSYNTTVTPIDGLLGDAQSASVDGLQGQLRPKPTSADQAHSVFETATRQPDALVGGDYGVRNHGLQNTVCDQNEAHRDLNDLPTVASVSSGARSSSGGAPTTANAFENNVWSGPLEAVRHTSESHSAVSLGAATLGDSAQPRTASTTKSKPRRYFVYSGDTLSHSFLPHMAGHRRFKRISRLVPETRQSTSMSLSNEPFPVATCPSHWWEPKMLQSTSSGDTVFGHLNSVDTFYLTRLKNVLYFPEISVARMFFLAFRDHVLPTCPVIDRYELTEIYENFTNGHVTYPMLLHSIFFSSSQYVSQDSLTRAGFDSLHEAKAYFYERATLLYALNCEYDQLKIIQTLLFVTRLSQQDRSMWRRILWTVYSRDCNASVAMGRPITINSKEIDVEELSDADFYERPDECPLGQSPDPGAQALVEFTEYSPAQIFYAIKTARQAALLDRTIMIDLDYALGSDEAIRDLYQCQQEITVLRTELCSYITSQSDAGAKNGKSVPTQMRWITFLQLSTERTLSIACRYLRRHIENRQAWDAAFSHSLSEVRAEMVRAAARTLNLYEELLHSDCLRYSPNFLNTPIFGAMVTYAEIIKEARDKGRVDRIATNKYELGTMILEEMESFWPASAWACSLFKILAEKDFLPLRILPHASRWQSPDPGGEEVGTGFNQDGPPTEKSAFDCDPLQDMNFFLNFNAGGNLETVFSDDLFDPQTWYAATQATQ